MLHDFLETKNRYEAFYISRYNYFLRLRLQEAPDDHNCYITAFLPFPCRSSRRRWNTQRGEVTGTTNGNQDGWRPKWRRLDRPLSLLRSLAAIMTIALIYCCPYVHEHLGPQNSLNEKGPKRALRKCTDN